MNILITGAGGFVGRQLVSILLNAGHSIIALDRHLSSLEAHENLTLEIGNILDPFDLLRIHQDHPSIEGIIHLAGILPNGADDRTILEVNIKGTSNVVREFASLGNYFLFFSTGLVYGPACNNSLEDSPLAPANAYAQSKVVAEEVVVQECVAKGSTWCIVRPSILYGNPPPKGMFLDSIFSSLSKGENFSMTPGEQFRDFLHIRDLMSAIQGLIESQKSGFFNISSGEKITMKDVAHFIGNLTGLSPLIQIGDLKYRQNESFDYSLDSNNLRTQLNWKPMIPLQEGLTEIWNSIQKGKEFL